MAETGDQRSPLIRAGEQLLERPWFRLALAGLILVSVLPLAPVRRLDLLFLLLFLPEVILRALVARSRAIVDRTEVMLLTLDAVALVSFLPLPEGDASSWIRLVRLFRLVLLVRFLRVLAADLRRILTQRHVRYQLGFLVASVFLLTFVGTVVVSHLGVGQMDFDGDGALERPTFPRLLWWTFRQVEDAGNLVEDPETSAVLLIASLVLTIAGVFVVSFIIGIGTSVVGELMSSGRRRQVALRRHTVVVGGGRTVRAVVQNLVEMYRKNKRPVRIAVLDSAPAAPAYFDEPAFRGVEYRSGEATDVDAHELVATARAKRVIVLNNDERGEASDAYAISSVIAARQQNEQCPLIVELRHRRNVELARAAAGRNTDPLSMGRFLGYVMSQNLMFPGIDTVFEELLTAKGSEIYTHVYSEAELALLGSHGDRSIRFGDLLLGQHRARRVIVIGALLGEGEWTADVAKLCMWLNPLDDPPEAAVALGARRGEIPLRLLRGLIAVAPEYSTLHTVALDLARLAAGASSDGERPDRLLAVRVGLCEDMVSLRRVLVLGESGLLPALLENTADFVPGVEIVTVAQTAERARRVEQELGSRLGLPRSTKGPTAFPLARGGSVVVLGAQGDMLGSALEHLAAVPGELSAVVLLADTREADPDANTTLMLFRLLDLVREKRLAVDARFRVVAEVLAGRKGKILEERLGGIESARVRVVSTQQMRSYFVVHSAYVPSAERVHMELLAWEGQDICQLRLDLAEGTDDPRLDFGALLLALSAATPPAIPIGVSIGPGHPRAGLVLNPSPGDSGLRFRLSELDAVYAVVETTKVDLGRGGAAS